MKTIRTINIILIISIIVWCLGWLVVGAYYCYPNAEDLSLTAHPRDIGIIRSINNLLISYDGRYLTNLMHGLNPLVLNSISGYKLMPLVGIAFFAGSFCFFLNVLFRFESRSLLLIYSLLFTAMHFATAPSLPHDLYWMVSSFVYLYPWGFTFLWVACYVRYITSDTPSLPWFITTVLFLTCAIGINEMFLVTNSLLLFVMALRAVYSGRASVARSLPVIMIGVCCILFFISCPGIQMRAADNRLPGEGIFYKHNLIQSVFDFGRENIDLLRSGAWVLCSILAIIHTDRIQYRHETIGRFLKSGSKSWLVGVLIIVSYVMTMAYYIPMQVDTGYPARIYNSSAILQQFAIMLLLPLIIAGKGAIRSIQKSPQAKIFMSFFVLLLLSLSIAFSRSNIYNIRKEFMEGKFATYRRAMESRYAAIYRAKKEELCWQVAVVDSLISPPATIYYGPEIKPNRSAAHWNVAYETYFGIDEIRITGDTAVKLSYQK